MIVVATHNGMGYLPHLLESLGNHQCLVADTGSDDQVFLDYLDSLKDDPHVSEVMHLGKVYAIGGYWYAYKERPDDWYLFLQDSMTVKDPDFLQAFQSRGDVMAWLAFPFFYIYPEEKAFVTKLYGEIPDPKWGIFGPIFYATRGALDQIEWGPVTNKLQHEAMERGFSVAFKKAGIAWSRLDIWENWERMYEDDYQHFTKKLPNRR
jgi:hypothetical protein